jgi:hypothetical protein
MPERRLGALFAYVYPANLAFATWTPDTMPADWPRYRASWEYGHAVRAVLGVVALCALIAAMLAETPRDQTALR